MEAEGAGEVEDAFEVAQYKGDWVAINCAVRTQEQDGFSSPVCLRLKSDNFIW